VSQSCLDHHPEPKELKSRRAHRTPTGILSDTCDLRQHPLSLSLPLSLSFPTTGGVGASCLNIMYESDNPELCSVCSFFHAATQLLRAACPADTYQHLDGSSSCIPCPEGSSTYDVTGAMRYCSRFQIISGLLALLHCSQCAGPSLPLPMCLDPSFHTPFYPLSCLLLCLDFLLSSLSLCSVLLLLSSFHPL